MRNEIKRKAPCRAKVPSVQRNDPDEFTDWLLRASHPFTAIRLLEPMFKKSDAKCFGEHRIHFAGWNDFIHTGTLKGPLTIANCKLLE